MRGLECPCTRLVERKKEASGRVGDNASSGRLHPFTLSVRPAVGGRLFYHGQPAVFSSRHGVVVVNRVLGKRPGSAAITG